MQSVRKGANMVAIRLRQLRRVRSWTQEDLADRAGVSQSQVSAWEGGRRSPDIDSVRKLAVAFEMPHDQLAREIGYIDPPEDEQGPPELPPVLLEAWRNLVRKHPELGPQLDAASGDPDFAGQIVDLSTALGYVIRGFLDDVEKPGDGI